MPTFSIVTANYNNGKYFRDCYYSILSQSFQDWELVVVDDCSSDDSLAIISGLVAEDPRVRLYKNEKNYGVGYTKARGIGCTQGKYIGILDPDDTLHPDALHIVYRTFEENKNTVGVCTKSFLCDQNMQVISKIPYSYDTFVNKPYSYLENGLDTIHHFFVFKSIEYGRAPGIDTSLRNGDDIDLYIKMEELGDIHCINDYLHYYRTSPKGLTKGSTSARSWYWVFLVLIRNCSRRIREQKINKRFFVRYMLERLIFLLREAKQCNDRETYRQTVKAFFSMPFIRYMLISPVFYRYMFIHLRVFIWNL